MNGFVRQPSSLFLAIFCFSATVASAQRGTKSMSELTASGGKGWQQLTAWMDSARNTMEVIEADTSCSAAALFSLQQNTKTMMGSVVYYSSGLLADSGWIRIFGSGCARNSVSLWQFNQDIQDTAGGAAPMQDLVIASDAIGGFFVLNKGGIGADKGRVYYLDPDSLWYEPLGYTYSEFIHFCLYGNMSRFYAGKRWTGWAEYVTNLTATEVLETTNESAGLAVNKRHIPVQTAYKNLMEKKRLKRK